MTDYVTWNEERDNTFYVMSNKEFMTNFSHLMVDKKITGIFKFVKLEYNLFGIEKV